MAIASQPPQKINHTSDKQLNIPYSRQVTSLRKCNWPQIRSHRHIAKHRDGRLNFTKLYTHCLQSSLQSMYLFFPSCVSSAIFVVQTSGCMLKKEYDLLTYMDLLGMHYERKNNFGLSWSLLSNAASSLPLSIETVLGAISNKLPCIFICVERCNWYNGWMYCIEASAGIYESTRLEE